MNKAEGYSASCEETKVDEGSEMSDYFDAEEGENIAGEFLKDQTANIITFKMLEDKLLKPFDEEIVEVEDNSNSGEEPSFSKVRN